MWKYRTPDELYHWGILGMRWGHRKAKLENKKNNKKVKKWSTKKKVVVTGTIAASAALSIIGAKKINSYVKSKNREIATMKGWKEYFKNINKGKSFKESISKYYDITNKANNDNFRTSLMNIIKSR